MANLPTIPRRIVTTEFTPSRYRTDVSALFSPYKMLGRAVESVAGDVAAISEDIQRRRAEHAEEEGANAVSTDEQGNPTITLRANGGRAAQAYNSAAQRGFLASSETQHATKLREESLKYEGRPEEFAAYAENYIVEAGNNAAEIDPVLRGPLTRILERYSNQSYQGLIDRKHRTDIAHSHDAQENLSISLLEDAKRLAKQGGTHTEDFQEIWSSYTDIVHGLGDNPEFAALGKNEAWATKKLDEANDQVIEATLEGVVDQVKDTKEPKAALASVDSILAEAGYSEPKREEKRLEWRAKVQDAASGRLAAQGRDDEAHAVIQLAPENFVEGRSDLALSAPAVASRIVGAESGGMADARNLRSSATGAGQFIESTWLDMIRRHRPELAEGKTRAQILMMRLDPDLSYQMVERHAEDNAAALQVAGFEPTPGNLYLAHFAGAQGAIALLRAPAGLSAKQVLGANAVNANPFLKGKTAAGVIAWSDRKMVSAAPPALSARGRERLANLEKAVAERNRAPAELTRAVSEVSKQAKSGLMPDERSLGELRGRVAGNPVLSEQLYQAEQLGLFTRAVQTVPPANLEAWVTGERARLATEATPAEVDRLEAAESVLSTMKTALEKDPVSWGARSGLIESAPLDLSDPASVARRRSDAAFVARHYRVEPKFMTEGERNIFVQRLNAADPAGKAELLSQVVGLPEDMRTATLRDIGSKGPDAMVQVWAGALLGQDGDVAASILRGQDAMKADARFDPSKDKDRFNETFDRLLPVTAFALPARVNESGPYATVRNAIRARYADLSALAGDTSAKVNEDRLKQAVDDITGGVLDHNGGKLIAPFRGMPQDRLDQLLATVTDEEIGNAGTLGGAKVTADYLRRSARLESIGDGRYLVQIGVDPATPIYAVDLGAPVPAPYVLDLKARELRGLQRPFVLPVRQ